MRKKKPHLFVALGIFLGLPASCKLTLLYTLEVPGRIQSPSNSFAAVS